MAGKKIAHKSTPAQRAASTRAAKRAEQQALDKAKATRLAQVVNLMIAGHSLADIGASIGATPEEVDRMLMEDTARYVKTQPALRVYVRNWISEKYTQMIEADWDVAIDKNHAHKLDNQDRVDKFLRAMARLHGAEAPTQTEVKVDAAPEAVEALVQALAKQAGAGYDPSIFDVVEAEVVHEAVDQSHAALEASSRAVEDGDEEEL